MPVESRMSRRFTPLLPQRLAPQRYTSCLVGIILWKGFACLLNQFSRLKLVALYKTLKPTDSANLEIASCPSSCRSSTAQSENPGGKSAAFWEQSREYLRIHWAYMQQGETFRARKVLWQVLSQHKGDHCMLYVLHQHLCAIF